MKTGFIKTAGYEALLAAYLKLEKRAAPERCFILVTGAPGVGKTAAIERFNADKGGLYVRASSVGGTLSLMRDIAKTNVMIDGRGPAHKVQNAIISFLVQSAKLPIIVDECQHLIRAGDVDMIESLRDISDRTGCPVILVAGELGVESKIARHQQIASRIAETVDFKAFSVTECAQVIARLTDIKFDGALVSTIHQHTGGKMRLLKEGVNRLEQFAIDNEKTAVAFVDVKDHLNTLLCHEWQASKPQLRRAA